MKISYCFYLQKSVSKAKRPLIKWQKLPTAATNTLIVVNLNLFPFLPLSLLHMQRGRNVWERTHTHTHSQNTPLYLQKAWGRQSAWINSLSAYISIPAYPTANKTQFTVNELLQHSWGSLTVTLHSTPITNGRKKKEHIHTHQHTHKEIWLQEAYCSALPFPSVLPK